MNDPIALRPPHASPRATAPEMTLAQRIRGAQADMSDLAAQQSREFAALLAVLVGMAEELAGADSIQPPGVREIARRIAEHDSKASLTLQAIVGRR